MVESTSEIRVKKLTPNMREFRLQHPEVIAVHYGFSSDDKDAVRYTQLFIDEVVEGATIVSFLDNLYRRDLPSELAAKITKITPQL